MLNKSAHKEPQIQVEMTDTMKRKKYVDAQTYKELSIRERC